MLFEFGTLTVIVPPLTVRLARRKKNEMDSNSPNSNTEEKDRTVKTQSPTSTEYKSSIDPKSVLIALAVMVPLFAIAFVGMAAVVKNNDTKSIDFISPVAHSFENWAAENPEELASIYDKEMNFSEFAAMVDGDTSAANVNVKVTKFGTDDSRICFKEADRLIGDAYLYSTLTKKVESVEKC